MKIHSSPLLSPSLLYLKTSNGLSFYLHEIELSPQSSTVVWLVPVPMLELSLWPSPFCVPWTFVPAIQSAWKAFPTGFKTMILFFIIWIPLPYIKLASQAWFCLLVSFLMICILPLECKPSEDRDFVGCFCLYSPSPSMPAPGVGNQTVNSKIG